MKNQHKYIRKFIIAVSLCLAVVGSAFSIEEKDYKSMTDRDRILLSISYYEVSMKYEALNNKALANSYRKEAMKIEPNVVKYYSGEWEVPKKTIEIDWNSIFVDETSDEEEPQNQETEIEEDDEEIYDVTDDIDDAYLDSLLNGDDEPITTEDDIDDDELLDLLDDEDENTESENNAEKDNSEKESNKDTENEIENEEAVNQTSSQSEKPHSAEDGESDEVQTEDNQTPQSNEDNINEDGDESGDSDWIPGQTSDTDTVIIFSQMVRGFIDGVNNKDADKAVKDFADSVTMQSSAFNMSKDELRDTIASWSAEHDENIPDYTDIVISDEDDGSYLVEILFDEDFNFFMPMNNKTIIFRINELNGKYFITEIKLQPQHTNDQVSADENDSQGYMYRFISMVLNGDYEFVAALLSKDIWISEFNMLFPASEIIDHLQNWALDNDNVKGPAEVIDVTSIVECNDAALTMIQSRGMSA